MKRVVRPNDTELATAEGGGGALHKHISGDVHSARGFHYECALRCLWLLDLKGTENCISIAEGEDAKITRLDGRIIYRQAKKREGGHWVYDRSLREFVERAYARFSVDSSIRHEFYTNQAIPSGKARLCDGKHLNSAHPGVRDSAPAQIESFCKTVRLFSECYQPEPSLLLLVVKEKLRHAIDSAYPGCQARNFVSDEEIDELAAKLLKFEYRLWSRSSTVGWKDVDSELGMDRLISDLRFRSMADGALTPFDNLLTLDQGGPDDEKTRAVEAVRSEAVISRPKLETKTWALIDEWWASIGTRDDNYLVVVLAGAHGTGKTWSLMHIGSQIPAKYRGVRVCVATASPPSRPFAFGNLAIAERGPCAILIDELFLDWSGLVSSITSTPPYPLLILGTASRPNDDAEVRGLIRRLGHRAKVVELPDYIDDPEAEALAQVRGVSLSAAERRRANATNIRHSVQLLTGVHVPDHLGAILQLMMNKEMLDLLGPILLCTSLQVAVPKELLERSAGRALPHQLQPWVLGSRGGTGELLSLENPDKADDLLTQVLGGARPRRLQDWCERFLQYVDPMRFRERAFTRHLFQRLARKYADLCELLLSSCHQKVDAVMACEPLWALIFSWLPILAQSRREELLKLALERVTTTPTTPSELAILVEAYGVTAARVHLSARLTKLPQWNSAILAQFVESVMVLPRDDRRDTAVKLTSLLVDLPADAFVETLYQRNCFNDSTNLASNFGRPADRKAFLHRIGEMTKARITSGGALKQNWFDASRALTERTISQERFGLAMKILRQMLIKGNMQFEAEKHYKICFEQEQALSYRPIIELGLELLRSGGLPMRGVLPPVPGSLVPFASSWADEEQWSTVVKAFIHVLKPLSVRKISFDRLAATVLPMFWGMRRGPQSQSEAFLKSILPWIPDESRVKTVETTKLVFQILGFVATQPWMDTELQVGARKALLEAGRTGRHSDQDQVELGELFRALRATLKMPATKFKRVQMRDEWIKDPALVNMYMAQVSRIRWGEQEGISLAQRLTRTWQGMAESRQHLTETLLRLGDLAGAQRFAEEMAKDLPLYPDPLGYLAIINVKRSDAIRAQHYLTETALLQDNRGRGLHPQLAYWVHKELASICEGRRRIGHLLCAELSRDRPLRSYGEVVDNG